MQFFKEFLSQGWKPNWTTHPPAEKALLEMVIVEPRCHEDLSAVLSNVSYMLPYAALTIIHSEVNAKYIAQIVGPGPTNIRMLQLLPDNMSLAQYSKFMMCPKLWTSLVCDKILIFQTDTGIFRNNVLDFLHVDYIGAPWVTNDWGHPESPPCLVGNGGFSLRSRTAMLEASQAPASRTFRGPEDVYFVTYVWNNSHNYELASFALATRFSMESVVSNRPFGFHKPWDYHAYSVVDKLFRTFDRNSILTAFTSEKLRVTDVELVDAAGTHLLLSDKTRATLIRWFQLGIGPTGLCFSRGAVLPVSKICKEDVSVIITLEYDSTQHQASSKFEYLNTKLCSKHDFSFAPDF